MEVGTTTLGVGTGLEVRTHLWKQGMWIGHPWWVGSPSPEAGQCCPHLLHPVVPAASLPAVADVQGQGRGTGTGERRGQGGQGEDRQ